MRKDIHPKEYRPVLFIDNSNGSEFIISSTVKCEETAKPARTTSKSGGTKANKKEYPVYRVEISSATHPFYTGLEKNIDTAGRVERFKQKQAKAKSKK